MQILAYIKFHLAFKILNHSMSSSVYGLLIYLLVDKFPSTTTLSENLKVE